jgi:outer membrane protein OmpA-like peptidoglycan-associated protein
MVSSLNRLSESEKKSLKNGVIEVTGKAMNRTALGVVDAIFTLYPKITFSELKEILPDTINPSAPKNYKSLFKPYSNRMYGVVQPGSIRKECEQKGLDINNSHFTQKDEIFMTSDGVEVMVSKTWESKDTETGENNLQNLINHVEQFGIRVVKVEKSKAFNKGSYNLEVINPTLYKSLQDSVKKKFPWMILLVILILVSAAIFFVIIKQKSEKPTHQVNRADVLQQDTSSESKIPTDFEVIKKQIAAGENTEGMSVHFDQILFKKNSDVLLPESEVYLNNVFEVMSDLPELKVMIVGHTSSEGDNNYNLKLSHKRANVVAGYLKTKGINSERISTEGKGSGSPIVSNDTEQGRKMNRRIEFVIIDDGIKN